MTSLIIRLCITIASLYLLWTWVNFRSIYDAVLSCKIADFIISGCVFLLLEGLLFLRWATFIKLLKLSIPPKLLIRIYGLSLAMNLFLPTSIGGDIAKVVGLRKEESKTSLATSLVFDRLSGFLGILCVAFIAYFGVYQLFDNHYLLYAIVLLSLATACSLIIVYFLIHLQGVDQYLKKYPYFKNRLKAVRNYIQIALDSKSQLLLGLLLSCACQVTYSLAFYFLARSLHLSIPLVSFMVFVPLISLVSIIPSLGGLGVREIGAVYLFGLIGVSPQISATLSLLSYFYMVMIGIGGWLFYIFYKGEKQVI